MNTMATACAPTITLFDVEVPIFERMVHLGLTKAKLYEKEPDEVFVFPPKVPGRRNLEPVAAIEVTVAMQLIETVRQYFGQKDVTPELVANWLCEQASRLDREIWVRSAKCLKKLVWIHLPKNINAWDLRRLASLVDLPESLFERAQRFQNEYEFFASTRMNEEALMKIFGVEIDLAEAHMYNVDKVLMNGE